MSMEDKVLKKFQSKSALLTLLMFGLVSLFAVGCGDDREDFVITNNNNAATGSLVFRFQRLLAAQTVDNVPAGTTTLRFDFFTTNPATQNSFSFTETRAFAEVVTFTNVPADIRSVLVTAFDNNGQPLATLAGAVTVVVGQTTEVNLNDAQPVVIDGLSVAPETLILVNGGTGQLTATGSFNNGSVVTLPFTLLTTSFTEFAGNEGTTANVSSSGLVRGLTNQQNATLNASYSFGGATQTDTVLVRTVTFEVEQSPVSLAVGNNSVTYAGFFGDSNGTTVNVNDSQMTYALVSGPTGTTVNATTGDVNVPTGTTSGTVVVRATWADGRTGAQATNQSFSDDVTFSIGAQ